MLIMIGHGACKGYLDLVVVLLEHGANLHSDNDCALLWSVEGGHTNVVVKLLEHGANVNANEDNDCLSALDRSIKYNHFDIFAMLLERSANVHAHEDRAVRLCMMYHNDEMMRVLLENGADTYFGNKYILEHLQTSFNKKMADVVLPYCNVHDYKYFPDEYIKRYIVPTKNSRTA